MLKIMIAIIIALLTTTDCGSAEINELRQPDVTIINTKLYPTSIRFQQIYWRVRAYRSHDIAMEFASALSHEKNWATLTGIAETESQFDPTAIGKAGEQGAFQVLASEWGDVPSDVAGQCAQASRILDSLYSSSGKQLFNATRKYNGSLGNIKTYHYATKVRTVATILKRS